MQSHKLILSLMLAFLSYRQVFGQSMPKYAAMVGGNASGQIRRDEFLAQQGVGGMRYIAGNHWEHIPIDSFFIIIIRDTAVIAQIKNKGQIFTPNAKAQLSKLLVNDRVLIYNMYGRDYGDKVVSVRPIEFIIE
jgi:hypothetical protein